MGDRASDAAGDDPVARRLAAEADGLRRQGPRRGLEAVGAQADEQRIAVALEQIDAQIERRRAVETVRKGEQRRLVAARQQALGQPVGQVGALGHGEVPFAAVTGLQLGHPVTLGGGRQALEVAHRPTFAARQPGQQQLARAGFRSGDAVQPAQAAQHPVDRLGDETAVAMTDLAMLAEMLRQHRVSGMLEREHRPQHLGGLNHQRPADTGGIARRLLADGALAPSLCCSGFHCVLPVVRMSKRSSLAC